MCTVREDQCSSLSMWENQSVAELQSVEVPMRSSENMTAEIDRSTPSILSSRAIVFSIVESIGANAYVIKVHVGHVQGRAHVRVRVESQVRTIDRIVSHSNSLSLEFENLSCSDDVPTCGDTCDRELNCNLHRCLHRCHMGDCELVSRGIRWISLARV